MMPAEWRPWVVMWLLAVAIYAVCKLLTWARTPRHGVPVSRQLAYLLAWPGMDAKAFFALRPLPPTDRPKPTEWMFAGAKLALGAVLIWAVTPKVPSDQPLLHGWVGMAGLVFVF